MRSLIYKISVLLTALIAGACEKEAGNPEFVDLPVVEAYLLAGHPFELKVSRQIPFSGDAVFSKDSIDLLEIYVIVDDQVFMLSAEGRGVFSDTSLIVDEDMEYGLEFMFNDRPVNASTFIPPKPSGFTSSVSSYDIGTGFFSSAPDPVQLTWDNPGQAYHIVLVENIEPDPEPIRDFGDSEAPAPFFRNEPTQGDSYEINSRTFVYLGTHRLVLFRVNPEYAVLYDQEDNTSQNLTDPSTDIENGYGIFTGLNSDTLWIEVSAKK